jgi:hypothetical protein
MNLGASVRVCFWCFACLTISWSTSCSPVDCPGGTVEQSGRCIETDPIIGIDDGGSGDGAAANGAGGNGADAAGGAAANGGGGGSRAGNGNSGDGAAANGVAGNGGSGNGAAGNGAAANGAAATGAAASGGSGNGGAGNGAAASSGMAAGEPCATAGAQRCSMQGAGNRDQCTNGMWTTGTPCASGETCVTSPTGEASCVMVAELCRGSGGKAVCDEQGSLVVCKADESIDMMMACESQKHCQAGLATKTCATCIPMDEHRCTGKALEQCGPDGMTFTKLMDCETEGLCNKMLGQCTDAVCDPGKTTCDGDSLVMCNADGTAVMKTTPCSPGMCDAKGGDCNKCEPGTKKCDGDKLTTCDQTGQTFMPTPCPSGDHCVGAGQCVECTAATAGTDCSALTKGCQVGVCTGNSCMPGNAPNGTACTADNGQPGKCQGGSCVCTPQCSGKQCGDNKCEGMCGMCTGTRNMCNAAQQCVACMRDNDCDGSSNGCLVGKCNTSTGTCGTAPNTGASCNGTGTCKSDGTCCQPNCGNKCSGKDSCGNACSPSNCSGAEQCIGGTCQVPPPPPPAGKPLYASCDPNAGDGFPHGDCGNDKTCTTIAGAGFYCYQYPSGTSCPNGMFNFMGAACVYQCDPTSVTGFCPNPLACRDGWCTP